jgi:flagellar hook-associated protein 3 FlgL
VQNLVQDVQTMAVAAGNGTLTASDRATYASQLEGRLEDLISLANTKDGSGNYVFAGYKSNTMPFTKSVTGIDYNGDQGKLNLQVGNSRQLGVGQPGTAIFGNIANGNGSFATSAVTTNQGNAQVTAGVVTDPSKITGHQYALQFTVSGTPAVTTYAVTNLSTGAAVPSPAPLPTPAPYVSGDPINFDGMNFEITGTPVSGDVFNIEPSTKQSMFTTLSNMIDALRKPITNDADRAALTKNMSESQSSLAAGLDNVLTARAGIGASLNELDSLDTAGDDANVQYASTLSDLQDLDIVKAISLYSQQQSTLEAAQKSFKTMSGLSLFNLI